MEAELRANVSGIQPALGIVSYTIVLFQLEV